MACPREHGVIARKSPKYLTTVGCQLQLSQASPDHTCCSSITGLLLPNGKVLGPTPLLMQFDHLAESLPQLLEGLDCSAFLDCHQLQRITLDCRLSTATVDCVCSLSKRGINCRLSSATADFQDRLSIFFSTVDCRLQLSIAETDCQKISRLMCKMSTVVCSRQSRDKE